MGLTCSVVGKILCSSTIQEKHRGFAHGIVDDHLRIGLDVYYTQCLGLS